MILKFRNGINGTLTDWTPYTTQYSIGSLKRRIESSNKGEGGVIAFDNVGLTLGYETGNNPVYNAFGGDLSAVQRYIFELHGEKSNRTTSKLFEGLADLSSVGWPDLERKISFEVVDKLKAFDIITNTNKQRTASFEWKNRISSPSDYHNFYWGSGQTGTSGWNKFAKVFFEFSVTGVITPPTENVSIYSNNGSTFICRKNNLSGGSGTIVFEWQTGDNEPNDSYQLVKDWGGGDNYLTYWARVKICDVNLIASFGYNYQIAHTQVALKKGETLRIWDVNSQEYKLFLVIDSWLAATPLQIASGGVQTTWFRLFPADISFLYPYNIAAMGGSSPMSDAYPSTYYGSAENYIDLTPSSPDLYGGYAINGFDALKILQKIVENAWSNITINNQTTYSQFSISLEYFSQLINEDPFNRHPREAVKYIADSLLCYVYFNNQGELVLKKKTNISDGTVRTFTPLRKKSGGKKKLFWDKLADAATVTVKSGKTINGVTLEGIATVAKYPGIKPRNGIKIEVAAPSNIEFTKAALDAYAFTVATEVMNFYGKRHYYYDLSSSLLDDMYDWDLLDLIDINGERYFILSLDIDEPKNYIHFELVSVQGYEFDAQQVRVPLSPANYMSSTGGSSSSGSGSGTVINYLASQPLEIVGSTIQLNYTDNLKLSNDNKFDTAQDIKTTSTTINFARMAVGGVPDLTYKFKNYGDEWIVGNQKIDGYQSVGGAADTNFRQKIYGDQKVTGNITVDGDIYIGGSINQVNIVDLNVSDHAIRLNKGGDNTTALDGGIEILGASDALLGSIKYNGNSWLSDIHFDLGNGKVYKINNVEVLNATTLGANVVNSSLTSIGTLNHDLNIGNTKVYKINGVSVLTSTSLGVTVVSSSLTSVGTLTTGVWNATAIAPAKIATDSNNRFVTDAEKATWNAKESPLTFSYPLSRTGNTISLNYNNTHFSVSSNQLTAANISFASNNGMVGNTVTLGGTLTISTPQDVRITASPTFTDSTLTGRLDQQGTSNSEFGSQSLLPKQTYYGNLGALNKKWLTLHAAELWVETLVAQDTIATIGGRVLVGPTTSLVQDLAAGVTTIHVKSNQMVYNDIVYMEANGKVEFMRINSSYSGSTGDYTYSVVRNLDGTGTNDWYAGDAMFNTGQAGNGFIDLYSLRGVKSSSQTGPTIVGNVRNSLTYNDWSEHWAIGNLNNLYGYTSNIYGVGLGKYSNSSSFITVDSTNGVRLRYKNAGGTVTDKITLDMSGNVSIAGYLQVGNAASDVNSGTTTISGSKITTNTISLSHLNFTPVQTSNVVASINASAEGITINGTKLTINSSTTFASGYDPSTKTTSTEVTTIVGNTVTTSYLNAKAITALGAVTAGTFSLGSGLFQVDANGYLITRSGNIGGWDILTSKIEKESLYIYGQDIYGYCVTSLISTPTTAGLQVAAKNDGYEDQLIVNVGGFNDGGYARLGLSVYDAVNSAYLLKIGYKPVDATHVAQIAGFNFDYQKIYGSASSKYTGMQSPAASTTKCFFAGATTNTGVNSRFYVQADGKIVSADANGNVLFDSDNIFADMKNIGRVFFNDCTLSTVTSTSYVTLKQGSLFLLPNETTVQLIFRGWVSGDTNLKGRIRFKLEKIYEYPETNEDIGAYNFPVYSEHVSFGDGSISCFDFHNTIIDTPEGEKYLYEIEKGDKVISFNEEKRILEVSEVEEVIISEANEYFILDGTTRVTGEHPLFVNLNNGGWMRIKDIQPGMEILKNVGGQFCWKKFSAQKINGKLKTATLKMKNGNNPSFIADGFIAHNKSIANKYARFGVCKIINSNLVPEVLYRWTIEAYVDSASYPAKIDNLIMTTGRSVFSQVLNTTGF